MWPQVASRSGARIQAARSAAAVRTRVAQVVRSLDTGGQEVLVARLVQQLDAARFQSTVIALQEGGWLAQRLEAQGFRVICLGAPDSWSPATIVQLGSVLRREGIQIVHCHNRKALLYGGLAALLAPQTHVVYTKHGVSHWDKGPTALLGRWVMKRADRVVAVSRDIESGLIAGNWAAREQLCTVLNGVDLEQFRPRRERDALRQALGIPSHAAVIGTVARLSPEKDQATLLRAFSLLALASPEARLMLVGDGALRGDLERLADELGIRARTHFLGERQDVAELLSAMDLFCLPSLTEGTSLTLLEAMATGLPVVATAVGGTPEVVAEGVSGRLVAPERPDELSTALLAVLHDPPLAQRMGESGRAIVRERYSLRAMVDHYVEIYHHVLS